MKKLLKTVLGSLLVTGILFSLSGVHNKTTEIADGSPPNPEVIVADGSPPNPESVTSPNA